MIRILAWSIIVVSSCGIAHGNEPASTTATAVQIAKATDGGSALVGMARDIARVGCDAAEMLNLPLGVGEVLLSPLPGIGLLNGVTHIGKGLLAPIKTGIGLLKLPYSLLKQLGAVKREKRRLPGRYC